MYTKIDELIKSYNIYKEKNNYNSDDSILIDFFEKEFDEYNILITLIKINDEYSIHFILNNDEKLLFRSIIKKEKNNLKNEFNRIKEEITNNNLEFIILKYYDIIRDNLN